MDNPFSETVSKYVEDRKGKLSFEELCGYYAAMLCEVKDREIEVASGLSQPTVSNLRHAGEYRSGQLRYVRIAKEYALLGREAFIAKYATPSIRERVRLASEAPRHIVLAKGFVKRRVDSTYIGPHWLEPRGDSQPSRIKIDIVREPDSRYRWIYRRADYTPADIEDRYEPCAQTFDTGLECYRHALAYLVPKD